jgi:hypothetical protein
MPRYPDIRIAVSFFEVDASPEISRISYYPGAGNHSKTPLPVMATDPGKSTPNVRQVLEPPEEKGYTPAFLQV